MFKSLDRIVIFLFNISKRFAKNFLKFQTCSSVLLFKVKGQSLPAISSLAVDMCLTSDKHIGKGVNLCGKRNINKRGDTLFVRIVDFIALFDQVAWAACFNRPVPVQVSANVLNSSLTALHVASQPGSYDNLAQNSVDSNALSQTVTSQEVGE